MIHTSYDPEADVLRVGFGPQGAVYDGAEEVAPGVFVSFDASGQAIGVEVLSIATRVAGTYAQRIKTAAE